MPTRIEQIQGLASTAETSERAGGIRSSRSPSSSGSLGYERRSLCDGLRHRVAEDRLERKDPLERGDGARAELGAGGAAKLLDRLVRRPRRAIDARRQHRVERVGDVDDARAERDLLALDPVRVAGAVPALVVVADRRHRVLEEAEAVDDARAL